jgi:hypothetical protein
MRLTDLDGVDGLLGGKSQAIHAGRLRETDFIVSFPDHLLMSSAAFQSSPKSRRTSSALRLAETPH